MSAGWSNLGGQARKFHYFPDANSGTRSLCRKWGIWRTHHLEPDSGERSPDDCVACRRRLEAK